MNKTNWEPKPDMPLAPIQHILNKLSYADQVEIIEFFIQQEEKRIRALYNNEVK